MTIKYDDIIENHASKMVICKEVIVLEELLGNILYN